MLISLLRSKLHKAAVTGTSVDYVGSITIDSELLEQAGMHVHEKVLVANINNGHRLWTYAIEGEPGQIELNGAAAKLADVGDRIIIMSFGLIDEKAAKDHEPKVIMLDEKNRVI